ncbi:MAG TPA: ABC transporter substrate-binding protein [Fimbriimonas sp.]|nr:ABC transporter substrate-binding protein [Fimbriimonas sp.]
MKHLFGFLALSLLALGCGPSDTSAGTAPSPGAPKTDTYTVGFSQIGAESAWRTAETKSVQDEAQKRGVKLLFNDGQQKQENQIRAIRSFINQKVDFIFLAPKVETGWDPVLREARAANIPVILLDRGIKTSDESLYTTLLTSDFVEEGRMAARWLAKKLDGKGNIVELQGTLGSDPANDRKEGFAEVLKDYPDMVISRSQTGDFTIQKGKEVMEAFLKSGGKSINAVYAHNDDMALGAIQAIEEAGLVPGKDIIVVGIDAVKQAFEAIAAGKMNCTVECNPLLGPSAFDVAEKLRKGEKVDHRIITKDNLYDESTATAELPNRKY